jgi:polyisoprenyl-phosphate glycosyltransferase
MQISVVVPVYNEEKNIPEFVRRIQPVLEKITAQYEIIFAMDPGRDATENVVQELNAKDSRLKLLKFSRRFGQPQATLAGLAHSKGDAVVVIDVDLQDPPELIFEMHEKFKQGFDVIYAQRKSRVGETLVKRFVSYLGYKFINHIAEVDIPPNTGDFRMMSRRAVEQVIALKESHGFLRGLVALVGFKQTSVMFDREARHSGAGNYNQFVGSLRIGFNGVFCFSNYMLSLSTVVGFCIALASFMIGIFYLVLKVMGFPFPLGNPTIVILVLFMGGVQLISVGILGEYIGRIYDEVKQRPKFIVQDSIGFKKDEIRIG